MGRRNVRINAAHLGTRMDEICGKPVHVVLVDGTTFSGKAMSFGDGTLKVQDANATWTNLKRHTHHIALTDILEVIIDQVTAY